MRGHEKLVAMRRVGRRPNIVFLNDFDCVTDWFETDGQHVIVCCAGDNLMRADLRFLVGLTVSAVSDSDERARELLAACQRAGAAVVGAGGPGWCEVWRKPVEAVAGASDALEAHHG